MRSSRVKSPSRRLRWLAVAGLVAVVPKCLVCLLGYAGLATALGLAGPELCGAPADTAMPWSLAFAGAAAGLAATGGGLLRLLRSRSRPSVSNN